MDYKVEVKDFWTEGAGIDDHCHWNGTIATGEVTFVFRQGYLNPGLHLFTPQGNRVYWSNDINPSDEQAMRAAIWSAIRDAEPLFNPILKANGYDAGLITINPDSFELWNGQLTITYPKRDDGTADLVNGVKAQMQMRSGEMVDVDLSTLEPKVVA